MQRPEHRGLAIGKHDISTPPLPPSPPSAGAQALVLGTLLKEQNGGGDVVLAFPLVGPNLIRLQQVADAIAPVKVSVLVESVADVAAVSDTIDIFAVGAETILFFFF